jgi:hypothetical protein
VNLEDIKKTETWELYEEGRNYHRRVGIYDDTDKNYRMYNGNQWDGAKLGEVEPVQKNFIRPIVRYKVSVVHDNLYAIIFSSQNYESQAFRSQAERYCSILNGYAAKVWEKQKMDTKGRKLTKDAAINDEGIMYVDFDKEKMMPVCEIVKKNDIYYGDENDDDIQNQPYILIRKRLPVKNAIEFAIERGMSEDKAELIIGDNDNFEESGDAAKEEKDDKVTIVYKLYKQKGTVHFSIATRYVDICKDIDLGISLYPVAHFNWEEKEGSARGEGEVRYLIPTQIEVNRIEMRRILTVKQQAYPMKVIDESRVVNPGMLNQAGAIIKVNGTTPVEDVNKIVGVIHPAQMSQDVKQLQDDLINMTRELANASDVATGSVNPEQASGRAILAVQQASQAPMTEQKESYKSFLEDVASIWLEYLIVHSVDGIPMEEKITDAMGNETIQMVVVPQAMLKKLQASVKIDVTPKSVYDRFAQEQTLENLLTQGFLHPDRLSEFEAYVNALDDDAVAPKAKLVEIVKNAKEKQAQIAQMEADTQAMMQRVERFLLEDPDTQASEIAQSMNPMTQGAMAR